MLEVNSTCGSKSDRSEKSNGKLPWNSVHRNPKNLKSESSAGRPKKSPSNVATFYAEFELGASDRKRSTDIHWRCRSGRASWNWRIKMPITLPLASPEMGRLSVLLWDKDVVKWNDVVGQTQLDLYRWLLKAYRENRSVNVFKEINDALRRKRAEEAGLANESDLESSDGSSGDEESDEDEGGDAGDDGEETKEEPTDDKSEKSSSSKRRRRKRRTRTRRARRPNRRRRRTSRRWPIGTRSTSSSNSKRWRASGRSTRRRSGCG